LKVNRLKKFETVAAPLIVADSPEELAALIADLLLIAERMPVEKIIDAAPTKYNSGDAKKIIDAAPTVFNSEELEILESLKDAEQ
jgi:hypothetical protein